MALIWGAGPRGNAIVIYHHVLPIHSGFRPGTRSIMYDTSIMYISPLRSPFTSLEGRKRVAGPLPSFSAVAPSGSLRLRARWEYQPRLGYPMLEAESSAYLQESRYDGSTGLFFGSLCQLTSLRCYHLVPSQFPCSRCTVWVYTVFPTTPGPKNGTASTRKHRAVVLLRTHRHNLSS